MKASRWIASFMLLLITHTASAETIELTVNGLVCGFCAQGIEKTLRKYPATSDVFVSLEHRLVAIATKPNSDIADDDLRKALRDAGYDVKAIARTQRALDSLREQTKVRQ